MKSIFASQAWNAALVVAAYVFGAQLIYPGWVVYDYFLVIGGSWNIPAEISGIFVSIPFLLFLLLSSLGGRWWYIWAVLSYLPFAWIFFAARVFDETWFHFLVISTSLIIGWGIRALLKHFVPTFFIFNK